MVYLVRNGAISGWNFPGVVLVPLVPPELLDTYLSGRSALNLSSQIREGNVLLVLDSYVDREVLDFLRGKKVCIPDDSLVSLPSVLEPGDDVVGVLLLGIMAFVRHYEVRTDVRMEEKAS